MFKTLDVDKATGPDKIPAVLLKTCAANISPSLCKLFNKSLSCGKLPSEWKLSNISPIPKKSPFHEVCNYRPIHFCRWSPRCLNVASTIELLTTSQVNFMIFNTVFKAVSLQLPRCFMFFTRFIMS